jgi:hypothetical protein
LTETAGGGKLRLHSGLTLYTRQWAPGTENTPSSPNPSSSRLQSHPPIPTRLLGVGRRVILGAPKRERLGRRFWIGMVIESGRHFWIGMVVSSRRVFDSVILFIILSFKTAPWSGRRRVACPVTLRPVALVVAVQERACACNPRQVFGGKPEPHMIPTQTAAKKGGRRLPTAARAGPRTRHLRHGQLPVARPKRAAVAAGAASGPGPRSR